MTYAKGSLISAADYNTFATNVNAIWGVGTGNSGYGCTNTVGTATTAVLIGSSEWTTLLARGNSTALHQGTTWSSGTSQTSQSHINVISTLSSDITSLSTNKNNTDADNLTTTPGIISTTNSSSWTTTKTYTFTVAFTGSNTAQDAARAYFNAGGKIQVSYSHSGGTGTKATDWDTLCTACGTTIFAYGSTTKSGGSGSTNILATTTGYFAPLSVSPTYTDLFKQFSANTPYTSNYVLLQAYTDTTTDPDSRGGKGSTLTFKVTFYDGHGDAYGTDPTGTWGVTVDRIAPNTLKLNNVPTATFTGVGWSPP